jgi:type II secretory pathway pseudopilin PulG
MRRHGFTFIELIFVVIIMGFLGKYGIEFLAQAYNNFIFSNLNNSLQSRSASAVESIASRLQFRIKDSIIARDVIAPVPDPNYQALASSTFGDDATVLEWVGSDIEGYRGVNSPNWSGVIDLYNAATSSTSLVSPDTNITATSALINVLSYTNSTVNDAAIYFIGSDTNINQYGWDGAALADQNVSSIHPINANVVVNDRFTSGIAGDDFNSTDVYEYYQLAWTAYAVVHNTVNGDLTLYYDYQPWNGQDYLTDGKTALLMENVSTFRFKAIGSIVKIQVCVNTDLVEDYSLCKEKTIY